MFNCFISFDHFEREKKLFLLLFDNILNISENKKNNEKILLFSNKILNDNITNLHLIIV